MEMKSTNLLEFSLGNKSMNPTILKNVSVDTFQQSVLECEILHGLDMAWIFTRHTPTKLLEVNVDRCQTNCTWVGDSMQ